MYLGLNFFTFLLFLTSVCATEAKSPKATTDAGKVKTTIHKDAKKGSMGYNGKQKAYTRGQSNSNSTKPADYFKLKGSSVSSFASDNDIQKETTTAKYVSSYNSGQNQQYSNNNNNMASMNAVPTNMAATLKATDSNLKTEPNVGIQENFGNDKYSNYWPYIAVTPLRQPSYLSGQNQQFQPSLSNSVNSMENDHQNGFNEGVNSYTKSGTTFPKFSSSFVANGTGFVPMLSEDKDSHGDGQTVDRFGQSLVPTHVYAAVDPSLLADSVSVVPNEWVAVDVNGNTGAAPTVTEQRSTVEPTSGVGYYTTQRDVTGLIPVYGISSFADDTGNTVGVQVPFAKYYVSQPAPARSNAVAYQGNYVYKGSPQVQSSPALADNEYKASSAPSSIAYGRDSGVSSNNDGQPVTKSISDYGVIGHRAFSGGDSYNSVRSGNAYEESQLNSFDTVLDRHSERRTVRSSTGDIPEDVQVESSPRSSDTNDFLPISRRHVAGLVHNIMRSSLHRESVRTRNNKN